MGEKQQALAVLQQASVLQPGHRGLNSEYGRLALEFDQVTLAEQAARAGRRSGQPGLEA